MTKAEKDRAQFWVDLLVDRAPALRKAGVLHLELTGCTVDLEPDPPDFSGGAEADDMKAQIDSMLDDRTDPLDDPSTYPGGHIPTLRPPD
jgi:hypothetical protein